MGWQKSIPLSSLFNQNSSPFYQAFDVVLHKWFTASKMANLLLSGNIVIHKVGWVIHILKTSVACAFLWSPRELSTWNFFGGRGLFQKLYYLQFHNQFNGLLTQSNVYFEMTYSIKSMFNNAKMIIRYLIMLIIVKLTFRMHAKAKSGIIWSWMVSERLSMALSGYYYDAILIESLWAVG